MKNNKISVKVPDPILEDVKIEKMSFNKKAILLFFIGFIFGWVWITWGSYIDQIYGINGLSFWRVLLPF